MNFDDAKPAVEEVKGNGGGGGDFNFEWGGEAAGATAEKPAAEADGWMDF